MQKIPKRTTDFALPTPVSVRSRFLLTSYAAPMGHLTFGCTTTLNTSRSTTFCLTYSKRLGIRWNCDRVSLSGHEKRQCLYRVYSVRLTAGRRLGRTFRASSAILRQKVPWYSWYLPRSASWGTLCFVSVSSFTLPYWPLLIRNTIKRRPYE